GAIVHASEARTADGFHGSARCRRTRTRPIDLAPALAWSARCGPLDSSGHSQSAERCAQGADRAERLSEDRPEDCLFEAPAALGTAGAFSCRPHERVLFPWLWPYVSKGAATRQS